jgi:hypothetical protein
VSAWLNVGKTLPRNPSHRGTPGTLFSKQNLKMTYTLEYEMSRVWPITDMHASHLSYFSQSKVIGYFLKLVKISSEAMFFLALNLHRFWLITCKCFNSLQLCILILILTIKKVKSSC